jgi:hypothetical protein
VADISSARRSRRLRHCKALPAAKRTAVLAWYNLAGSLATAAGALCGGALTQLVASFGVTGASRYRPLVMAYAAIGFALALAFARLSPSAEAAGPTAPSPASRFGLRHSSRVVLKLAVLLPAGAVWPARPEASRFGTRAARAYACSTRGRCASSPRAAVAGVNRPWPPGPPNSSDDR